MSQAIPYKTCGAKKRNGEPCNAAAMPNGRCRIHGGLSLAGPASPRYKHGERSKYIRTIPEKLRKGYKAALEDQELLSLKDDIAVLEAKIGDLFEELENTKAPPWDNVLSALETFERTGSPEDFDKLNEAIRQGKSANVRQEELWYEIKEVMALKGKLSATDHKRQVDIGVMVSVIEATAIINRMIDVVKLEIFEKIEDAHLARQIMGTIAQKLLPIIAPAQTMDIVEGTAEKVVEEVEPVQENGKNNGENEKVNSENNMI